MPHSLSSVFCVAELKCWSPIFPKKLGFSENLTLFTELLELNESFFKFQLFSIFLRALSFLSKKRKSERDLETLLSSVFASNDDASCQVKAASSFVPSACSIFFYLFIVFFASLSGSPWRWRRRKSETDILQATSVLYLSRQRREEKRTRTGQGEREREFKCEERVLAAGVEHGARSSEELLRGGLACSQTHPKDIENIQGT